MSMETRESVMLSRLKLGPIAYGGIDRETVDWEAAHCLFGRKLAMLYPEEVCIRLSSPQEYAEMERPWK